MLLKTSCNVSETATYFDKLTNSSNMYKLITKICDWAEYDNRL